MNANKVYLQFEQKKIERWFQIFGILDYWKCGRGGERYVEIYTVRETEYRKTVRWYCTVLVEIMMGV